MIKLNVYDLHQVNDLLHNLGVGAYHTGVELDGVEFAFGGHNQPGVSGVFETTPKDANMQGCTFRETIELGAVAVTAAEKRAILAELKREFDGTTYHLLQRNCNTFSNELVKRLTKGQASIPGWVTRLTDVGSTFASLVPPAMLGSVQTPSAASSSSSSSSSSSAPIFGGPGHTLSGSATTTASAPAAAAAPTDSAEERRRKQLAAIEKRLNSAPPSL